MHMDAAIMAFLADRQARGRTQGTITAYRQHLVAWQAWRRSQGWGPAVTDVTLAELRSYVTERARVVRPRSVRNEVRSMRAFWSWLSQETDEQGRPILTDTQRRVVDPGRLPLPRIVERERPAIRREQVDALLTVCDATEAGARDRAIVLLLWESGLRVHEVAALTMRQLDIPQRTAIVIGKGDREAAVFWGPETSDALEGYLTIRRGPGGGPLFRGCSSRNPGGPVTANLIRLMLKRRARAAGVALPMGAPVHSFRHGAAREWRRRGASRDEVGALLRHRDLSTTLIYLGLDVEPTRQLHRRLSTGTGDTGGTGRA